MRTGWTVGLVLWIVWFVVLGLVGFSEGHRRAPFVAGRTAAFVTVAVTNWPGVLGYLAGRGVGLLADGRAAPGQAPHDHE